MELSAWVSIDNRSGATYKEARLKLVAGTVHRVQAPVPHARLAKAMRAEAEELGFEEEAFFEYHLYTLSRPSTLKDNQIKQISLFPTTQVHVRKNYYYDGSRDAKKVKVKLEFLNSKEAGVGMALPGGKVRIYKEDRDQALQFIGEDGIEHTPKDEKVRLTVGDAFDVVGERKVMAQKRITDRTWEDTVEITLRNHKEEAVTVHVVEHLWGDWTIRERSHEFVKKDAHTMEFTIPVPKDAEVTVHYTVRYTR